MEKERNSNFELLRIIAMLMIIAYHFSVHGCFSSNNELNKLIINTLSWGGKIGVNVFCLLMGYFGIKSKGFKIYKLIKIELQVLFYSYLGLVLALFIEKGSEISIKSIIVSLLPTITEQYWFFTAYIIVLCFSGFINEYLVSIQRRRFKALLFLCYLF